MEKSKPPIGTRLALRAAGLVREGVDSPMETRVRLLIVLAGLPEPSVNHIVRAEDGSWRMRFVALNLNLIKGRREFLTLLDQRLMSMGFAERTAERSRYLSRPE